MNYVGIEVLARAVTALGTAIQGPPADEPRIFGRAREFKVADMPALTSLCIALDPLEREDLSRQQSAHWLDVPEEQTNETDRVLIVLSRLRRYFGGATLSRAIEALLLSRAQPVTGPIDPAAFGAGASNAPKPPNAGPS